MSRVQLGLNVTDIDAAVAFYERAFGVPAAKRRPGYANFEIAEPPLKLVLFEGDAGGTINHLGVEVGDTDEVHGATRHLRSVGLETRIEDGVDCCHAIQDKVWVSDPDGLEWEWYTVLADSPGTTSEGCCTAAEPACC